MKRINRRMLAFLTALLMMTCPLMQVAADGQADVTTAVEPTAAPTTTEASITELVGEATEFPAPESDAESTGEPTPEPTAIPTAEPIVTETPTAEPTAVPTSEPTATPTIEPVATESPTPKPTAEPTAVPVENEAPTAEPTATPTIEPVATKTPTPEPTVEPTAVPVESEAPTAEPTATPTIEPVATEASTPKPTDEPTPEPTDAPTATPTPTSLVDLPSFHQGYVYLTKTAKGYLVATGDEWKPRFYSGTVGYTVSRPAPGSACDRLQTIVNLDGEECIFYIDASALLPYPDEQLEQQQTVWKKQSNVIQISGNLPLPTASYQVRDANGNTTPVETPAATEEPTVTEQPVSTDEPAITAQPVVTEEPPATTQPASTEEPAITAQPVVTEEPPATTQPVSTGMPSTTPAPTLAMHEISEPFGAKGEPRHSLIEFTNQPLFLSQTANYRVVSEENVGSDAALPQSASPYPANLDDVYILNGSATAARMTIRFSSDTVLEDGYDLLLVYDAQGYFQAGFTGSEAAGITVNVPGNKVYIRLLSDDSISHVGFRVVSASCYDTSELTNLYADGLGNVTVKWYKPTGTKSFQLQRAEVDPATGSIGPWTTLLRDTNASSYKDFSAKEHTLYAYRLRVYSEIQGEKYYAKYHTRKVYNFSASQITNGEALTGGSIQIRLSWEAVKNGNRYQVYRSETIRGMYTKVGETTATTFTDNPPDRKTYYYKVKAFAKVGGKEYPTYAGTPVAIGFPAPPEGLKLRGTTDNAVKVKWTASPGATGYIIYRSNSKNKGYTRLASVKSTSYIDTTIQEGKQVWYKVRTYQTEDGGKIYSDCSAPVSIVPLAAPVVTAKCTSKTSVKLTWKAVEGAKGYRIYYSDDLSKTPSLLTKTSKTTYTATNLTSGAEYACFIITAYRTDGKLTSLAPSSRVNVQVNPVVYRAVLVGQTYENASGITTLYGPANDIIAMRSMLKRMDATPYSISTAKNLTGQGILNKFSSVLRNADSNDITLLYYSGHGAVGGYLVGTDGMGVSPALLRSTLDQYQGKKFLILDCCYSGKMIGKNYAPFTSTDVAASKRDLSGFNSKVTGAFASANRADNDLATSGYYVITACRSTEQSYENWTNDQPAYGVFTRSLTFGSGWNCITGKSTSALFADTSRDGLFTLKELYNYALKRVDLFGYGHIQHAQAYPSGSNQVIYGLVK